MSNDEVTLAVDDAKKKLGEAKEASDIWSTLKQAMANLLSLKITTQVTGDGEPEELVTIIDLFGADRCNKIHRDFIKDPELAVLREFHAEQVRLAEEDIQEKVEFLMNLGRAITRVVRNESET